MEDYKVKYEDSIEKAKQRIKINEERGLKEHTFFLKKDLEYIFPGFTEYDSERIRKAITDVVKFQKEQQIHKDGENGIKYDDMISWLEDKCENENEKDDDTDFIVYHPLKNGKGEYESIPYSFYGSLTAFSEDKDLVDFLRTCFYTEEECKEWIKSQNNYYPNNSEKSDIRKFSVDDWVVLKGDFLNGVLVRILPDIDGQSKDVYNVEDTNGITGLLNAETVENGHLWSIKDAKDGDVLAAELQIFNTPFIAIYKNQESEDLFKSHCYVKYSGGFEKDGREHSTENIHPATKEQSKIIFRKMNEKGYEWDSENKELKKYYVPKFGVGDFVVSLINNNQYRILDIVNKQYKVNFCGNILWYDIDYFNNWCHTWTIADAEDGDILCTYEFNEPKLLFILKGTPKIEHSVLKYHCYYDIVNQRFETDSKEGCIGLTYGNCVKPVTNEQRILLFKNIREQGYKWDDNEKVLKKNQSSFEN